MTDGRKGHRGFASMSPAKRREIASKGGKAAHEKGTAHEWTPDEARAASRKGGQVSPSRISAPAVVETASTETAEVISAAETFELAEGFFPSE